MKRLIFSLLFLLFTFNSFGQATPLSLDNYLQKSKEQQRAGWVLLAGGTTLALAGMAIAGQEGANDMGYGNSFDAGMWLLGAGILLEVASIPFFISSAKNAKRAATLSLGHQAIHTHRHSSAPFKFRPTLTITLAIR